MSNALKRFRKFDPNWDGYTPDQRRHHRAAMNCIRKAEWPDRAKQEIGHYLHIRAGKSMLIRMLTVDAVEQGFVAVGLAINNRSDLRIQIVEDARWDEDFGRLNTTAPRNPPFGLAHVKVSLDGKPGVGEWPDDPWPNEEYLLSTSIQTLCRNIDKVAQWVQSINHKTGLPVLIHLDEAQDYGINDAGGTDDESKDWDVVLRRLQAEANVILNTLSGFPFRSDGKLIPGFKRVNESSSRLETVGRGKLIRVDPDGVPVYEKLRIKGNTLSFNMEPIGGEDFITPIRRGFDTGRLCPISHDRIAHKITLRINGNVVLDNQSLADVDKETSRKIMAAYLSHPEVIDIACCKLDFWLEEKREVNDHIKALVYSMADGGGRSEDEHARQIQERLSLVAPHLTSRILTNNTADASAESLLAFRTDDYDVLILKNRGRVGFDCPVAKIELDLSTVRAPGMVAQTWLRPTTPFDEIPAVLIAPGDPISTDLFERIVTNSGGNPMKEGTTESEVDGEMRVPSEHRSLDVGDQVDMPFVESEVDAFTEQLDKVERAEFELVNAYLGEVPGHRFVLERLTLKRRVEFVKAAIEQGGWRPPAGCGTATRPSAGADQKHRKKPHKYRSDIISLWDKVTHKLAGTHPPASELSSDDMKRWRLLRRDVMREAKRAAGQPEDRKLSQIKNLDALDAIEKHLEGYLNACAA